MELIKWEPFKEIDRFFDDRFLPSFPRIGLDPAVDIYKDTSNVVEKMSLPAVKAEGLDVTIEEDAITISGKREEEKETEKKDYYSKEIRRGSFSRRVSLPRSVDASKAQADYKEGMLTVTMPSVKGKGSKSIKVTVKK